MGNKQRADSRPLTTQTKIKHTKGLDLGAHKKKPTRSSRTNLRITYETDQSILIAPAPLLHRLTHRTTAGTNLNPNNKRK
jgi:hypothetical protein